MKLGDVVWVKRLRNRYHADDRHWDSCRDLGMEGKSLVMFRWTTPGGEAVAARYIARELWDSEADCIVADLKKEARDA